MLFASLRFKRKPTFSFVALGCFALAVPAFGQIDLSGSWLPYNESDALSNAPGPRPLPLDFLGIPLTKDGQNRGLLYSPSYISMPERICSGYPPFYMFVGPPGLKIWNEQEPLTGTTLAWHINAWEDKPATVIWMDGRPHPSDNAPHPSGGFTTGKWENDVLVSYTTHFHSGLVRRSGAMMSDKATMTIHFFRRGEILTVTGRVDDPYYLSEPYYLTRVFREDPVRSINAVGPPCVQGFEGVQEEQVPHFYPGKNEFVGEITRKYNIPAEAYMGGAETMYPEFRKKLQDRYKIPDKCPAACGGPGEFGLRGQ